MLHARGRIPRSARADKAFAARGIRASLSKILARARGGRIPYGGLRPRDLNYSRQITRFYRDGERVCRVPIECSQASVRVSLETGSVVGIVVVVARVIDFWREN